MNIMAHFFKCHAIFSFPWMCYTPWPGLVIQVLTRTYRRAFRIKLVPRKLILWTMVLPRTSSNVNVPSTDFAPQQLHHDNSLEIALFQPFKKLELIHYNIASMSAAQQSDRVIHPLYHESSILVYPERLYIAPCAIFTAGHHCLSILYVLVCIY